MILIKRILRGSAMLLIVCSVFIGIYYLWTKTAFFAELLPWYVSLIIFVVGLGLFSIGKYFLMKEYVLKRVDKKIVLSTPLKGDISYIFGVLLLYFSVISCRYFFIFINFLDFELIMIISIAAFFLFCYLYFIRLKYALNDQIIIDNESIIYDNPISTEKDIFRKDKIVEIVYLKEFTPQIDKGTTYYKSDSYNLALQIICKNKETEAPLKINQINPDMMNIDLNFLIEAIESMDYGVLRKSKYQKDDILWDGHNFEDGHL